MGQVINTNIASLTAQRNLSRSQKLSDTALQRLSSGLRINSAKDDAAGLAISSRFDSQIRGSNQAIRNSGDAISLSQTAEGALSSINTALQRMRELALQSANDTNTAVDRQALQEEVAQLVAEIETVADTSNFNGKKLLDGSFAQAQFQTGSNVGETISFGIAKVGIDSLGTAATAGLSSRVQTTAIIEGSTNLALVAGDLVINGITVEASIGTDDNFSEVEASSSAIAKAAAVNRVSDQTGVVAKADANYVEGATGATTDFLADTSMDLNINGVDFELGRSESFTALENLEVNANIINQQSNLTGVRAEVGVNAAQGITLIADDGRNIALETTEAATLSSTVFGIAQAGTAAGAADVYLGGYTLTSTTGEDIVITTSTDDIDRSGFEEGTFSGVNSGVIGEGGQNTQAGTDQPNSVLLNSLSSGDLVINGVTINQTDARNDNASTTFKSNSALAKAAAINAVSAETGVSAEIVNARLYSGTIVATTADGSITINGISIDATFSTDDDIDVKLAAIVDSINAQQGATGVVADTLDGDSFTLSAIDGRNIQLGAVTELGELDAAQTYVGAVALKGGSGIKLESSTNNIERWGFRVGDYGGGTSGGLLQDLDVSTVAGANNAVLSIDNALATVATLSAQLGAVQNRFESVISNLQLRSENLSAANSRITDADFAQETARLTKSQVLQQAGISILAQANARPQQVLSLLG